jgi:hypothetical protein
MNPTALKPLSKVSVDPKVSLKGFRSRKKAQYLRMAPLDAKWDKQRKKACPYAPHELRICIAGLVHTKKVAERGPTHPDFYAEVSVSAACKSQTQQGGNLPRPSFGNISEEYKNGIHPAPGLYVNVNNITNKAITGKRAGLPIGILKHAAVMASMNVPPNNEARRRNRRPRNL